MGDDSTMRLKPLNAARSRVLHIPLRKTQSSTVSGNLNSSHRNPGGRDRETWSNADLETIYQTIQSDYLGVEGTGVQHVNRGVEGMRWHLRMVFAVVDSLRAARQHDKHRLGNFVSTLCTCNTVSTTQNPPVSSRLCRAARAPLKTCGAAKALLTSCVGLTFQSRLWWELRARGKSKGAGNEGHSCGEFEGSD